MYGHESGMLIVKKIHAVLHTCKHLKLQLRVQVKPAPCAHAARVEWSTTGLQISAI